MIEITYINYRTWMCLNKLIFFSVENFRKSNEEMITAIIIIIIPFSHQTYFVLSAKPWKNMILFYCIFF
jgi:hypothetical protein